MLKAALLTDLLPACSSSLSTTLPWPTPHRCPPWCQSSGAMAISSTSQLAKSNGSATGSGVKTLTQITQPATPVAGKVAKKKLASSFIHVRYIPPSSHSFADPLQEAGGSFLPAALLPPLRLAHHRRRMVSPRPRRRPAANPHAVHLHLAPTTTPGQRRPYAGHHASSLWRGLPRSAGNRLC